MYIYIIYVDTADVISLLELNAFSLPWFPFLCSSLRFSQRHIALSGKHITPERAIEIPAR